MTGSTPPQDTPGPQAGDRSLAVAVPLDEAETVRRKLAEQDLLRDDLEVRRDEDRLLIPVTEEVPGRTLVEAKFEPRTSGPSDYRELLDLPDDVASKLPSSWDQIGELVVFKLPDELEPYRAMVGEALREFVPSCRLVCLDRGVQGRYRVRDLERVAGEGDTRTTYREHGVTLEVDPAKAYFSPRLATERRRLAEKVQPGEVVIDAFAGVGPVSLVLDRHADPERIVAIELNPDAYALLEENVQALDADVEPVHADTGEVLGGLGPADRIVLNLPHDAEVYLDLAREALAPGGTVHLYAVVDDDAVADRIAGLEADGWSVAESRKVHNYSPAATMRAFDLQEAP